MEEGARTKTSQINAGEYEEYFSGFLKAGKDVLHLCLSSGVTGTVNSARAAENRLRVHHWFFSTDLRFYIKGGRISKTAGTIGSHTGPGTVALFFWGSPRAD